MLLLLSSLSACIHGALGYLKLSSVFRDHMVLQEPVADLGIPPSHIFGMAYLNETVVIVGSSGFPGPFRVKPNVTGASDSFGNFSVAIVPDANDTSYPGPYTIQVYTVSSATNSTVTSEMIISDVYFGDVFLCSGQSNMELSVSATDDKEFEYAAANDLPNIRLFTTPTAFANSTLQNVTGTTEWKIASNQTIPDFSAVCWMHGRLVAQSFASLARTHGKAYYSKHNKKYRNKHGKLTAHKKYIGLIQSTIGGTSVYFWAPGHVGVVCNSTGQLPSTGECAVNTAPYYSRPGSIYNAMINPLAMGSKGLSVAGVLWYQGEADSGENDLFTADSYVCQLFGLINSWRDIFGNANLTFIIIQLPNTNIGPYSNINSETGWQAMQIAQYRTWQYLVGREMSRTDTNDEDPLYGVHTGLVVLTDQGQGTLHYGHKLPVAQRAFLWTQWLLYGNISMSPMPPVVKYARYVSNPGDIDGIGSVNQLAFVIKIANAGQNGLKLQEAQNCTHLGNVTIWESNEIDFNCCELGGMQSVSVLLEGTFFSLYDGKPRWTLWDSTYLPANVTFVNEETSNETYIVVNPVLPGQGAKWPAPESSFEYTDIAGVEQFFIQTSERCSIVNENGLPIPISGPYSVITGDLVQNGIAKGFPKREL